MNEAQARGRVYAWTPDPAASCSGSLRADVVPLLRLDAGAARLHGRHVRVRNAGSVVDPASGERRLLGDALPDAHGDFLFEPGRGGGRMDKVEGLPEAGFVWRYEQAAHFGEVNAYFHVDRIAARIDTLLRELGAPALPPVNVVVNAHDATPAPEGECDGVRGTRKWLPFQGGHYRLSQRRYGPRERNPIAPEGEIHLGPGWRLLEHGALVDAAGGRYRANASHNAGILFHEYGHHINRHTADFEANTGRRPDRQSNTKAAIDEGTCDYWAAAMLETPHIWALHQRHDDKVVHARSLVSKKTMSEFDRTPAADPHANGTLWAAALWDARTRFASQESRGPERVDRLLLLALLLLGRLGTGEPRIPRKERSALRSGFPAGLSALLRASALLENSRGREVILESFLARGIRPDAGIAERLETLPRERESRRQQ